MRENKVSRECRPCTACCEGWLRIETSEVRATLGSPCAHCNASGCAIYTQRPVDPCQTFICGWRVDGSVLPDWMRPELCRAIVMFDRLRWRDQPVTVAVAMGASIPDRTLAWLKQHAELFNRPLLWEEYEEVDGQFTGRKRIATHGPEDFGREMLERHGRGEMLW